jgi:hypothetical protein
MSAPRSILLAQRLAVTLAVIGSLLALVNEWTHYNRSGVVDWGHVALAIAVPFLIFAIVRSASTRQRTNDAA